MDSTLEPQPPRAETPAAPAAPAATPPSPAPRARRRRVVSLSIVMPVLNEATTVRAAIDALLEVDFPCPVEIIVVDDGSTDETPAILASIDSPVLRVHRHSANKGKGAALRSAAELATGTHMVPFDADLEYAAEDLVAVLRPVLSGQYDVVFGTRMFGINTVYRSYRYAVGNRGLTFFANVLFDSNVTDLHTCLKLMPVALFRSLNFREHGFGLDTEVTAMLLRLGVRPFEVPISYHSRTHQFGKKVSWRDGIECLKILVRVRFASRVFKSPDVLALAGRMRSGPSINRLNPRVDREPAEEIAVPTDAISDRESTAA